MLFLFRWFLQWKINHKRTWEKTNKVCDMTKTTNIGAITFELFFTSPSFHLNLSQSFVYNIFYCCKLTFIHQNRFILFKYFLQFTVKLMQRWKRVNNSLFVFSKSHITINSRCETWEVRDFSSNWSIIHDTYNN